MATCKKCGKQWPEPYCPECGQSIGKPPPLPPPVPAQCISAPAKKSLPTWLILSLVALAVILVGAIFFYHMRATYAFPAGYRNQPTAGWGVRMGEKEFDNADNQINSFQGTNAFGNSPQAVKLAGEFAAAFSAGRAQMFTPGFKLEILDQTKGEFMTYCELHAQECALIVHVPQLRKFERDMFEKTDARNMLAQLAWVTAQQVLKEQGIGKRQMELAVGLRGFSQYGPIMLGYYDENAKAAEDGLVKYLDDSDKTHFLWTFFAPESQPRPH